MRLTLLVVLAMTACATPRPSLLYTGFGRADPRRDEEVALRWKGDRELLIRNARAPGDTVKLKSGKTTTVGELARARVDEVRGVEVLVDTVPEGIEMDGGSARVKAGSGFVLLGRFTIRYDAPRPLTEAVDDVKVLVNAAEGTLAIVSWVRSSQRNAGGVVGLVFSVSEPINRDKLKSGKVTEL